MRRALLLLALSVPAAAHETHFGLSPHTVYRDGWLVEASHRVERRTSGTMRRRAVEEEVHALYGIRADLSAGLKASWMRAEAADAGPSEGAEGPGEAAFLAKYRLFRIDGLLATDYVSVLSELALPTARRRSDPALSEGAASALVGLGYARVRKFWSGFLDAGVRVHDADGGERPGNVLLADAALSWRPRVAEIDEWDVQAMAELNWERDAGHEGHAALFLSPGLSVGTGTTMLKAAVQLPVRQDWEGRQPEVDYRLKLTLEHLF